MQNKADGLLEDTQGPAMFKTLVDKSTMGEQGETPRQYHLWYSMDGNQLDMRIKTARYVDKHKSTTPYLRSFTLFTPRVRLC